MTKIHIVQIHLEQIEVNPDWTSNLEQSSAVWHNLEHFRLLVDQQGVAVVTDSHRLWGAWKLHLVVAATVTKDPTTVPEINFLLQQTMEMGVKNIWYEEGSGQKSSCLQWCFLLAMLNSLLQSLQATASESLVHAPGGLTSSFIESTWWSLQSDQDSFNNVSYSRFAKHFHLPFLSLNTPVTIHSFQPSLVDILRVNIFHKNLTSEWFLDALALITT